MTLEELRTYHKILILGYAVEGRATEKFIRTFHPSAEIGIADQKDGPDYLLKQSDYDLAIRTPLLRPKLLTIPYTTGSRLFFGNSHHFTIGITGTKGKSTSVSLLYHILRSSGRKVGLYGNIGTPMIDILTDGIDEDTLCILELSNYQLEDCEYSPNIACFLNIYEETHNHDSYEEYFQAKTHITRNQTEKDHFFYNGNFDQIASLAQSTRAHVQDFQQTTSSELIAWDNLPFVTHPDNIRAVWSICEHLGLRIDEFNKHLQTFTPLDHRLSPVGTVNGITFYDDSASIHPSSTIFALRSVPHVESLIMGGDDRGYDMHELADTLVEMNIPVLVCMGDTGLLLEECLKSKPQYHPKMCITNSLQEGLAFACDHTHPGNVCLLSSGAPSYGLFENLVDRGNTFTSYVHEYAQKEKDTSSLTT